MPGKQVSVLNSNMLKTRIAEPTLFITKKTEPSATEAKYYTMGGSSY